MGRHIVPTVTDFIPIILNYNSDNYEEKNSSPEFEVFLNLGKDARKGLLD